MSIIYNKTHLFICIHGLYGSGDNLAYVKSQLEANDHSIYVCTPTVNTTTGIDNGASIIFKLIKDFLVSNPQMTHISLLGHSLGGLYARYVAKLLYEYNLFNRLKPMHFITFGTPHLGSLQHAKLYNTFSSYIRNKIIGITGKQLMLDDDLLVEMTSDTYINALLMFSNRCLYTSVINDTFVDYCSSAISLYNPYENIQTHMIPVLSELPLIVDSEKFIKNNKNTVCNIKMFQQETDVKYCEKLQTMFVNLQKLNFERIDVVGRKFFAHTDLIVCSPLFKCNDYYGKSIIKHLIQKVII